MSAVRCGQRQIEFVAVVLETVSIDVDKDRIAEGDRRTSAISPAHHLFHCHAFADGCNDQMRVAVERETQC